MSKKRETMREGLARICDAHGVKWKAGSTKENIGAICDRVAAISSSHASDNPI